jgi:hypothetical protein
VLVLVIIYVVPFLVYGAASAVAGLQPPDTASPVRFLSGVLVTKVGTAVALVLLFKLANPAFHERWLLYAAAWFVMFALSEVGDTISGRTTVTEAGLGVLSELIYVPAAVYATRWMVGSDPL